MPRQRKTVTDGRAKDKFAKAADEMADDIVAAIQRALDAKQVYSIRCPGCSKDFKHPFPNIPAMVNAAQFLIDNGYGKPGQQKAPVEEPKVSERKLQDLTDEELLALLEG